MKDLEARIKDLEDQLSSMMAESQDGAGSC